MKTYQIPDLSALRAFAADVRKQLHQNSTGTKGARVFALHGNLGAGKTTFVQELARELGVTETVTSPTFVIMKQYDTTSDEFPELVHIDAYRVETADEMRVLGFQSLLARSGTLVCIEWAEKIAALLPEGTTHVEFTINDDQSRTVNFKNDI